MGAQLPQECVAMLKFFEPSAFILEDRKETQRLFPIAREQIAAPFPVVSIDLQVAANAPFGDYTLRLQSNSGETAYEPGAMTIDPGVVSTLSNPVDDFRFFITQQYTDLTGREPDAARAEVHAG